MKTRTNPTGFEVVADPYNRLQHHDFFTGLEQYSGSQGEARDLSDLVATGAFGAHIALDRPMIPLGGMHHETECGN